MFGIFAFNQIRQRLKREKVGHIDNYKINLAKMLKYTNILNVNTSVKLAQRETNRYSDEREKVNLEMTLPPAESEIGHCSIWSTARSQSYKPLYLNLCTRHVHTTNLGVIRVQVHNHSLELRCTST